MKGNSLLSPGVTPSSSSDPLRREFIDDDEEEQEFEFSVAFTDRESCTISADEIFHNGRIRPIYPLFDTRLVSEDSGREADEAKPERAGLSLGRLLKEERGEAWSSSADDDELQGLAPDTYCVWTPNREAAASPGFRKKSNSTGSCSSNRWKLRNILSRSSSEGRENGMVVGERESALKRRR